MDGNQPPQPPQQPQDSGSWQFNPNEGGPAPQPAQSPAPDVFQPPAFFQAPASQPPVMEQPAPPDAGITWTASEFIAHHKTPGWYGMLAFGALAAAGITWVITRDLITSIAIVGAAGLLAAFANRQPRDLTYRVDHQGVHIGPKFYRFDDFRSFAIMVEGAFASIAFTPLKRFAPLLTVYYDPKDESKIVDILSNYLPMQPRKADPIDRLMWRIRF